MKSDREYPSRPIPGVAATVIFEGKVLLVMRANEPARGKWGLPGGVVELGERVDDAVIREVKEETGLNVRLIRMLTVYDSIVRDEEQKVRFHYVLVEMLCEVDHGSPEALSDALDVRWVPLDELDSVDLTSGAKRLLEQVVRGEV
jgi:8-oxo-dGTP diphosphatase